MDETKEEFLGLFGSGNARNGIEFLKKKAMCRELGSSTLRSLLWRVSWGVLSIDGDANTWVQETKNNRTRYNELQDLLLVDPHQDDMDPTQSNPLTDVVDSPWVQYFQMTETRTEIHTDVERTFPEYDFFESEVIRNTMEDVLLLHTMNEPETGYRQGMHEILAIIIYLLTREYTYDEEEDGVVCSVLFGKQYLESDAFAIFEAVMKTCRPFFGRNSNANQQLLAARKKKLQEIRVRKQAIGDSELSRKKNDVAATPDNPNIMVVKGEHIQNELLLKFDPELATYLQKLGVAPQLYMMKWVRLLFGREFHIEDVLILWDAMFADDTSSLDLMDYIIVSMIVFIRGSIIGLDESTCLRRLLKYPPVEDVGMFVTQALAYRDPTSPYISAAQPLAAAVKPSEKYTKKTDKKSNTTQKLKFGLNTKPKETKPVEKPKDDKYHASISTGDQKKLMKASAGQLSHAVEVLQTELLSAKTPDIAMCHMVVAELKRIRDILAGDLEASEIDNSLLKVYAAQAHDHPSESPSVITRDTEVTPEQEHDIVPKETPITATPVRVSPSVPVHSMSDSKLASDEDSLMKTNSEPVTPSQPVLAKPKPKKKSVFEAVDKQQDDEIFGKSEGSGTPSVFDDEVTTKKRPVKKNVPKTNDKNTAKPVDAPLL